ncbi:glutathione S-transferase family protein [Azospirillum sp. sgz301742]
MSDTFTVYGNFVSQPATRIVLFLTMAGVPFAYRHIDLKAKQQKTPEYLAITRFGRVPALVHGDVALGESGPILTYLAEQTGQFGGRDTAEKLRLQDWLSWLADVLLPVQRARAARRFNQDPAAWPWVDAQAANGLTQLDQQLAGKEFLEGGRVTIADIFAFPWIDLADESAIDLTAYPNVAAWRERFRALPGVKPQYELMPQADVG